MGNQNIEALFTHRLVAKRALEIAERAMERNVLMGNRHYGGGLRYTTNKGRGLVKIGPGHAACGRSRVVVVTDPSAVTCGTCERLVDKALADPEGRIGREASTPSAGAA